MKRFDSQRTNHRPTKAWYLFSFFGGIIGGIIGYLIVRGDDKKMANKLLIVGIVGTIFWGVFSVWFANTYILSHVETLTKEGAENIFTSNNIAWYIVSLFLEIISVIVGCLIVIDKIRK